MRTKDLTIILPTLNEEKNIPKIINALKKVDNGIQIVVCDDGSKDSTKNEVKKLQKRFEGITFLDRKDENIKGLTASAIDGILFAKTRYFIVMDADLQHPPEKIKEFADKFNDFEVLVGTREKIKVDWPLKRRIISKAATMLGKAKLIFSGVDSEDIMSGFFGAKTELFKETFRKNKKRFVMEGYKVLFDFLKCLPKQTKAGKIYYDFGLRTHGESKIGKRPINAYLKSIIS